MRTVRCSVRLWGEGCLPGGRVCLGGGLVSAQEGGVYMCVWKPYTITKCETLRSEFYWILTIEVISFIRWRSLNSNCCCLTGAPVEPVDLGNGQL